MPNGLALAISLLVILMFLAYIISIILNFFTPFYTTPRKVLKEILPKFDLKKDQKFADLGCGDGRVVFGVYKKYKCYSAGYEISPVLLMMSKLSKLMCSPFNSKVQILEENFLKANLSEYDVIYCCLPNDILEQLEQKFKKELKKGARVYSYKNKLPKKKGLGIHAGSDMVYGYTF